MRSPFSEGATHVVLFNNSCQFLLNYCEVGAHPSSGTMCHLLPHRGEGIKEILKQVQDDINIFLKRTYSPIHLFTYSHRKRAAFTLAEVLITLGIIGVVAAMTMPSLIADYQKKQTAIQLKKAYSTFAQALVSSQYENGNAAEWDVTELGSSYDDNLKYFEQYWKPYLKIIKVCKTMKECGYDITGYAFLSEKNNYYHYGFGDNIPGFIYGDGTCAYIRPYSFKPDDVPELQLLSIDINGAKGPNIIGRDVFHFKIDISKGVIAAYYKSSDCTREKINSNRDYFRACGGKIMADGWEIRDDYPW